MSLDRAKQPFKASLWLMLATVFWGLSFLSMKALVMTQEKLLPEGSTWFFASLSIVVRFAVAGLILFFLCLPTLRKLTRLELWQGAGLALFGSIGLLFQMDGVNYTSASTSAFLTQFYCLILPFVQAVREHRRPPALILLASVLVLSGMAILVKFDWREMRLGRGEWETILASLFFTGQILWLERPKFAANNASRTTLVMFLGSALVILPVALYHAGTPSDLWRVYQSGPAILFTGILILFCTLAAYYMMNRWQPEVTATQAGLIYCAEPVFTSLFALCLPAVFSQWAMIQYANETLTPHLILGGGLILTANVMIITQAARR
ncbi:MAG: DMT family transporter [Opitutaceae bacterium]|nr:DMT family transporter [Verrucomicrobiales bacterium]